MPAAQYWHFSRPGIFGQRALPQLPAPVVRIAIRQAHSKSYQTDRQTRKANVIGSLVSLFSVPVNYSTIVSVPPDNRRR